MLIRMSEHGAWGERHAVKAELQAKERGRRSHSSVEQGCRSIRRPKGARKHGGASQPATAARRRTRRGGQAAREARRLERGRGVVEDARQHALRVAAAAEVVHEEEGEHAQPVGGKRAPLPAGWRRGPIQGVKWQPLASVSALSRPAAEPKAEHDERRSAQTESSHLENLGVQRLDGRRQVRRLKVDCSSVPRHILRRTARPEAAEPGRAARTRLCKAVPKLLEKVGAADDVLIWSKPARNRKRWKDLEPLGCVSEVTLRRGEAATGRPVHDAEPTLGVVGKTADRALLFAVELVLQPPCVCLQQAGEWFGHRVRHRHAYQARGHQQC